MDNYKDIHELLKPRRDIKASDKLRRKVYHTLESERRNIVTRNWLFGGISVSAVAAILILALLPSGISAKEILADAIYALGRVDNIEMTVEVRTRPVENFRFIDINEKFVPHRINVFETDSLLRWRVDKGERVAVGYDENIYTWIPSLDLGLHLAYTDKEKVLGYMANLLTPKKILETELKNCDSKNFVDYKVSIEGSDIILTVHALPSGNFDNPYLLNTSIAESENIRRYVIDSNSKRLKSATVSVKSGNRDVEVLRISSISYDNLISDLYTPDKNIQFVETEFQPEGLKGLSAEEAASMVLNAFADWDHSILDKAMIPQVADKAYRDKFQGSKLISIGREFTSGSGATIFVPYTLKLRDGSIQRHNLSLQKSDIGGWLVVGGL